MDSNEIATGDTKRFHFEFLLSFLLHPTGTFPQVMKNRTTWVTPLLVVSVLIGLRVLLAPPTVSTAPVEEFPGPGGPAIRGPKGMQNMQDLQLVSARSQGGGGGGGGGDGGQFPPAEGDVPVKTGLGLRGTLLYAVGAVFNLWVGWLLLSFLLYIGMVISGSNNSFTQTLNLAGWASLPLGLRQIAMTIAAMTAPALAGNPPGLGALTASMSGPAGIFLSAMLKLVDIYLVWQVVLLVIGLRQASPLAPRRVLGVTLGAVVVFLALAAMPGFLSVVFAQLTAPVPVGY